MNDVRTNLFVFTGGPGSGKTSEIEALRARGHACAAEAGRSIIRDQMRIGGNALPWRDRELYAEIMLAWELRTYREVEGQGGSVFLDRGLPDIVGYLRLEGLPVPEHTMRAAKTLRYNRRVFLFPPWPEIFAQDAERKQTVEIAERTYAAMAEIYAELGYETVEVPRLSVPDRARFIMESVSEVFPGTA